MYGLKTLGMMLLLAAWYSLPAGAGEKIIASTAEDGSGEATSHFEITEDQEERRIVVKSDPHFGYYTNPRYQEHNWYPSNGYDYVRGYVHPHGASGGAQHRQQHQGQQHQGQNQQQLQAPQNQPVNGQGMVPPVQGQPAQQGSVPVVQGLPSQQGSIPGGVQGQTPQPVSMSGMQMQLSVQGQSGGQNSTGSSR